MFIFDESYDRDNSLPPQDIREDFSGLTFEHGMNPQVLLDQLACSLPASVLAAFMDDLANGRVWVVTSTYHTYPDLVYDKGRLAETTWRTEHVGDAISAIIAIDPEAIVLRARIGTETIKGLAPGGLAWQPPSALQLVTVMSVAIQSTLLLSYCVTWAGSKHLPLTRCLLLRILGIPASTLLTIH